jgi:hypothetical protein
MWLIQRNPACLNRVPVFQELVPSLGIKNRPDRGSLNITMEK